MLDIKRIIADPETIQRKLKARDPSLDITELLNIYTQKRDYDDSVETKRAEINRANKEMAKLKSNSEEFNYQRDLLRKVSDEIKALSTEQKNLEQKMNTILLGLPNIIQDDVPISQNKEESIVLSTYGMKKESNFPIKDHLELVNRLGIIDFARGSKLAETGFPLYVGKGAILEFALLQFMIEHHTKSGLTFVLPPILNNTATLTNAGNLPKFAEQIYSCKDDDLHLVPTAEVPLTGMFAGEVLHLDEKPLRFFAYTPNFRREAGGYGKRDRGLMRIHQFNKVETYSICQPKDSEKELDFLLKNATALLEKLDLHYRLTKLPSCDLAQQSAKTCDIEIWLPFQDRYSEVSSGSNCTDYQARRANIKYQVGNQKSYVNTLNCSGLATPRVMVALLESYQTKDGRVRIPSELVRFTGFDMI